MMKAASKASKQGKVKNSIHDKTFTPRGAAAACMQILDIEGRVFSFCAFGRVLTPCLRAQGEILFFTAFAADCGHRYSAVLRCVRREYASLALVEGEHWLQSAWRPTIGRTGLPVDAKPVEGMT